MDAAEMPAAQFWRIIERAARAGDDQDAHVEALRTELRELSLDEIVSFEVAFRRHLNAAYSWDLWGAAYVIHSGCSDDGFEYFRRWLVARGRDTYEQALAHPDSLAQLDGQPGFREIWWFEEIYYVAGEVFEEKGGDGDVRDCSEPEAGAYSGAEPTGEQFQTDDAYRSRRYPRLWQQFAVNPRN
jgi:hypothetical protein